MGKNSDCTKTQIMRRKSFNPEPHSPTPPSLDTPASSFSDVIPGSTLKETLIVKVIPGVQKLNIELRIAKVGSSSKIKSHALLRVQKRKPCLV